MVKKGIMSGFTSGLLVLGLLGVAQSNAPKEVPGPLAVGYWGNANVSMRYWMNPTMGLDAGVGFDLVSNANRFCLEIGAPMVLKSFPTLLVEARPMFQLLTLQNVTTDISIGVGLLAEWFLPGTDNHLSISGGPQFGITISSPAIGAGTTTIGTSTLNLLSGGLRFYF